MQFHSSIVLVFADPEDEKIKEELGRQMLRHCAGLPLAIIVLGGLLFKKETAVEWEMFGKNVKKHISEGKGKELQDSKYSGVSWVLGLSYDELPYFLKPCFLYLAIFPGDSEIRTHELCQMWMAEGFISSEEMGYDYLHELVQRCMVQRGVLSSINKRIRTCRVHDLMRDLCLSKVREENFLRITDFSNGHMATDTLASSKVRRLAMFYFRSHYELPAISKDGSLRSFICHYEFDSHPTKVGPWFDYFRLLRVLKLENLGHSFTLPREIGKLIHLRFLRLQGKNSAEPFPSSIRNLTSLQTLELDLQDCGFDFLSKNVSKWRLEQLRHLYLPSPLYSSCFKVSDKQLLLESAGSLQTLVNISTSYPGFNGLARLTRLTKLKVVFDEDWQGGVTFNCLRFLRVEVEAPNGIDITPILLSCPQIYRLKVSGRIPKFPEDYSQFSSNLLKLTLIGTWLKNDPMPTLGKLPMLRILRLLNRAIISEEIVCLGGGFPRLESLHFWGVFLENWRVDEGALLSLCHLTIEMDLTLRRLPEGLRFIATLKEIVLDHIPVELVRRLKEGGEDFYKFRHVPSLVFLHPYIHRTYS
ncbi:putative disease resistance RPP8-like protein 2 [Morus notabilis]|uniref:Putative disease resistance RPP8-like protein 2 n=1 Tax=Morus notabilis TaxID=981085 RepID=W9QVU0_9ROSA|nr:putative disease resistance RPP8-like protein 2 [Morus notabilis]